MDPITGLAIGRIALGTLSLISPTLTAKALLLDPRGNPQLAYVTRMFGSREIALGALTLASKGEARKRLLQIGVAVDAADAFTGVACAKSGATSKTAGLLLTAVAAGAVATGVQGLQEG